MRILVDTHAFMWFADGDSRLKQPARILIEDMRNVACVSMASIWEMAIKESIGKLKLRAPLDEYLARALTAFEVLAIDYWDAISTAKLPLHHRDPFDRMLVAQSLGQRLPIISHDVELDAYGVERWWNSFPE